MSKLRNKQLVCKRFCAYFYGFTSSANSSFRWVFGCLWRYKTGFRHVKCEKHLFKKKSDFISCVLWPEKYISPNNLVRIFLHFCAQINAKKNSVLFEAVGLSSLQCMQCGQMRSSFYLKCRKCAFQPFLIHSILQSHDSHRGIKEFFSIRSHAFTFNAQSASLIAYYLCEIGIFVASHVSHFSQFHRIPKQRWMYYE